MKVDGSSIRYIAPLYPTLFSYLLGIILATHIFFPPPFLLLAGLVTLTFAFLLMARLKKRGAALLLFGSFFWLGALGLTAQLRPELPENHVSHFTGRERVVVEGLLTQPPDRSVNRVRLHVKAETLIKNQRSINTTGMVLVSLPSLGEGLNYGDRIRFSSSLGRPTNFNNPGGFDYQRYLATREIWTTAFVDNPRRIIRVATRQGSAFRTLLETSRNRIRAFLDQYSTPLSGPILKALVLGERGTIPESVREDFSTSGAAHIMAISGLHLGIIAFFLFRGLLWILRRSERITLKTNVFKLSALLTIPPVLLYTLVAGARITTIRATIMIIVYLVSILIDRPRDLYHTLALAALVITLIDPGSLLEPSFQLSFMAVLAILFLVPRFSRLFRRDEILPPRGEGLIHWVASWSRELLLISVAAIIGTGPIIAYHFHRISTLGVITNFLVIPLLGFLAIPAALISSLLSLCSVHLAIPFVQMASWVVDLTVFMVHGLASLPGASFHVATPTLLEISLFYAFVALILHIERSTAYRIALAVILCFGAADIGYWLLRHHFNQTLRITSIDVGQGDCALVEFPGGKRALIDGGGFYDDSFDIGKNVVAPFLWKRKIMRIDFLVLTHPDPDHLNGLKFVARTFKVRELWDSGQESDSPFFQELMTIVKEKGIRRISLFRGDAPQIIDGVIVHPLHPRKEADKPHSGSQRSKPNNRSLVLRLAFGRQTFLFTGDIEREAEAELIASGVDLESRVIKVPHHGSLTSSTPAFLAEVQPEIAIISARRRSFFSLPSTRIIKRYERFGCRIFRTDLHVAITVKTNGERLQIETFRKPSPDAAHRPWFDSRESSLGGFLLSSHGGAWFPRVFGKGTGRIEYGMNRGEDFGF